MPSQRARSSPSGSSATLLRLMADSAVTLRARGPVFAWPADLPKAFAAACRN